MAVFRVERTRDYTVMSNHHLKNKDLTLKAKGLLSFMLSLPEDWNYTTRGLAAICKEGVESIGNALKELENAGYIIRNRLRDEKGRITDTEYVIYEQPQISTSDKPDTENPGTENPYTGNPDMDKPDMDEPDTEKSSQINTIKNKVKKDKNTNSIPFPFGKASGTEKNGIEKIAITEQMIKKNIAYDILCKQYGTEALDEIVALILEIVCTKRKTIRVARDEFPAELVKSKLLKINSLHVEFVLECLANNTTKIQNIKQYLLTVLFNAPNTMDSYYRALVNYDLYRNKDDG